MNESKAINALTNIFHIETYTGENGNYELSSNSWGLHFDVRIREYTIFIQDGKGARCSIDSDEDANTISQEIVAFIGEVLKDESKNYSYESGNQILAWPFNCNMAYVKGLIAAMWAMPDGAPLTNSKKPVKSSLDESSFSSFRSDLYNAVSDMFFEKYRDTDVDKADFDKAISWVSEKFFDDSAIESSMQGQERGIQAIMDEYGCTREEAIEIMNQDITSGCHGDSKKKNKKKEIESAFSPDDYEFYYHEGQAAGDSGASVDDNPYTDDPDKSEAWLDGLYDSASSSDGFPEYVHSSVNRNHKNIQALYK